MDQSDSSQNSFISQNRAEYISLYELIEWAKNAGNHENLSDTASDILRILGEQNIALYREYGGLKPCIEKDKQSLKKALEFVKINNDYFDKLPF